MLHSPSFLPRRRLLAAVLSPLMLLGGSAPARPQDLPPDSYFVVVSSRAAVQEISRKELLDLYTGRVRSSHQGQLLVPLDQPRASAARAGFYLVLSGLSLAQVNSYWARLQFTGRVQPPQVAADEAAVAQRVRADVQMVGYLTQEPRDPGLRVVLRLSRAAQEAAP